MEFLVGFEVEVPAGTPHAEVEQRRWASCPICWGQRRIWDQVQAANGEGTVLVATRCRECLGIGQVFR